MEQKQHHYIPICYSKNFANSEGYIFIKDSWSGNIFPSNPANALKQGYLYTQPVHSEQRFDNSIENFFSRTVESDWPTIVEQILKQKPLTEKVWGQLLQFMMSLRVRVPNTIKAVIHLLREVVIQTRDKSGVPPPVLLVEMFRRLNPDNHHPVQFSDLVTAGLINISIDPHTAIVSFANLIRTNRAIESIKGMPKFLHNMTDTEFISSDNPVLSHIFEREISDISPYSYDDSENMEIIFPISARVALLLHSNNKPFRQHNFTYSRKTVQRINEKISLYADRYFFGSSHKLLEETPAFPERCPIPCLSKSIVGNGAVYEIGYDLGPPIKTRNKWKYEFDVNDA